MFSVEIDFWRLAAVSVIASAFVSCGSDASQQKAVELFEQAKELQQVGQYEQALSLLDSIDHAYASAVDVRRQAISLRPLLIEQVTNRQLEIADSLSAVTAYRLDSLSRNAMMVSNPIENYYVPRCEGRVDVSSSTGLHARMAPDGRFYLIATAPGHIGMNSVTLSCNGATASTPVVTHDGERSDRSGANDVITFIEGECQEIGALVLNNAGGPVSVTYSGAKSVTKPLSETQIKGVAVLFEIASLIRERKKQELEKQKLERMLQAVRDQIARTASDTIPDAKQ